MSIFNPRNPAEASDGLATLTAAATGLAALVYAINVVEVFVPESTAELFGYVQIAGGVLIVAIFAPLLIHLKRRGAKPAGRGSSAGYLNALFRQASLTAFSITLAVMVLLSMLESTVLAHLAAETVVDGLITFALAMFAISFFMINRFGALGEGAG